MCTIIPCDSTLPCGNNKRKAKKTPFYFRLILLFLTRILFGKLVTKISLSQEPCLVEKFFDMQLSLHGEPGK